MYFIRRPDQLMRLRADIGSRSCISRSQNRDRRSATIARCRGLSSWCCSRCRSNPARSRWCTAVARARVDLRPLVADRMRRCIQGVGVLRGLRLQGAGERIEVRAQQGDVVHAKAAADRRLVIVERPIGKAEARHKPADADTFSSPRDSLPGCWRAPACRGAIDRRAAGGRSIGRTGIGAGQKVLRQQACLPVGIDRRARARLRWDRSCRCRRARRSSRDAARSERHRRASASGFTLH